jgi:hypothetical protein
VTGTPVCEGEELAEISREAVYFAQPGRANTDRVLELVRLRAVELGVRSIIVPTSTGETGVRALAAFPGFNLVVVSHSTGFTAPDVQELLPEHRQALLAGGASLLTTTHAFGGIGRSVRRRLNTFQVDEIIAHTLRVFGEGLKVACEVTLMAADAGLIRVSDEAIALGGTGHGLDTAVSLQPAHAQDFFSLRIREIICKPRL